MEKGGRRIRYATWWRRSRARSRKGNCGGCEEVRGTKRNQAGEPRRLDAKRKTKTFSSRPLLFVDRPGLIGVGPPELSLVVPDERPPRPALKIWLGGRPQIAHMRIRK